MWGTASGPGMVANNAAGQSEFAVIRSFAVVCGEREMRHGTVGIQKKLDWGGYRIKRRFRLANQMRGVMLVVTYSLEHVRIGRVVHRPQIRSADGSTFWDRHR
jgi:hypothetical protein